MQVIVSPSSPLQPKKKDFDRFLESITLKPINVFSKETVVYGLKNKFNDNVVQVSVDIL